MFGWIERWRDRRLSANWLAKHNMQCHVLPDQRVVYVAQDLQTAQIAANMYAYELSTALKQVMPIPLVHKMPADLPLTNFWLWATYEPMSGLFW
jgi:hypothetical protein